MNFDHLSRAQLTVFERLDDAGVRTACTPFLIFRGRTRHELGVQGWLRRVAQAANFRHAVYGPAELFYGELYSSQEVDCRPTLARPGTRDPYSGCVGALPRGARPVRLHAVLAARQRPLLAPLRAAGDGRPRSRAPTATWRELAEPAGGIERFLDDHAVILMADHAQIAGQRADRPRRRAVGSGGCCSPTIRAPTSAELAVSPGARSAMVYVLGRRRSFAARACRRLLKRAARSSRASRCWPGARASEACVWTARGELRFAPGRRRRVTCAARAGTSTGDSRRSSSRHARRRAATSRDLPGCAAAHLVGARRARARATCWCRPRAATSSSTGAAPTTSAAAATARCAAATRSAPLAFVNCGPDLDGGGPREWPRAVVDHRRRPDRGARPLRRRSVIDAPPA